MIRSLLKGGVLGGLAMFLWGAVSWTVLPWRRIGFKTFVDESAVLQTVSANALQRGIYTLPRLDGASGGLEGPRLFLAFDERSQTSRGRPIGGGMLIQIAGGLCLTWLLLMSRLGYWGRVASATAAGLFAGVVADLANWNWWGFSTGYTIVSVMEHALAGFLAGVVIAWAIQEPVPKPKGS